ncbi:hypothetical protein BLA29_003244 [Euroglyphus maynei]|uniref:Uncharacterized protein n=1 Tax=Euroglyphus maynei TaxID=6958 RepID=A0A1Y3AWC0_EURMA|nr:hypothetical protein BLA29_003244 [Euroglyphus maynei]
MVLFWNKKNRKSSSLIQQQHRHNRMENKPSASKSNKTDSMKIDHCNRRMNNQQRKLNPNDNDDVDRCCFCPKCARKNNLIVANL